MTGESVEVVQRAIAALNERDVDAYLALCDPEVELVTPVAAIEGASVGEEGIRQFFSGLEDAASDFRIDVEQLKALGADRVFALLRVNFTSRGGISLVQPTANLYDLVGGKLRRVHVYLDRDEAYQAAGLSE
jgi:ketosteroid isomerase-like protein